MHTPISFRYIHQFRVIMATMICFILFIGLIFISSTPLLQEPPHWEILFCVSIPLLAFLAARQWFVLDGMVKVEKSHLIFTLNGKPKTFQRAEVKHYGIHYYNGIALSLTTYSGQYLFLAANDLLVSDQPLQEITRHLKAWAEDSDPVIPRKNRLPPPTVYIPLLLILTLAVISLLIFFTWKGTLPLWSLLTGTSLVLATWTAAINDHVQK